ncbi:helix-turn-helix transcriptional regulator [Thiomicrorhabdus sp. zzn3]|uniref:helix-turn-helix transcriptional regulator n=1 Tax=Thiomicrorhabdus sp. zzn3 TaxID=3039775 RepID=UPI002437328A|nr:helix-turn-helix transcriptional regulator [Thiomicrorhabdus sp. zzn3]MDG6777908.1 helix-turn-helix transcriptional regulator [Thiomicrorhabdus sp. zzn3]
MNEVEILKKLAHIQSCLIYGHSLQAILQTEVPFIKAVTNCNIMAIALTQQNHLNFEFVLDSNKTFLKGLKRFKSKPYHIDLKNFSASFQDSLTKPGSYKKLESLQGFFEGQLNSIQCQALEKQIKFESAYILPIFCYEGNKIGYSMFVFQKGQQPKLDQLNQIHTLFQSLIQPLYDIDSKTFYSKCTRVCTDMPLLTETEKRIIKLLSHAKTYQATADELNISLNTVKTHMKNIFAKYHVNSKLALFNKINNNV